MTRYEIVSDRWASDSGVTVTLAELQEQAAEYQRQRDPDDERPAIRLTVRQYNFRSVVLDETGEIVAEEVKP